MSASTSSLLRYFVFIYAYDENSVSQKYIVEKEELFVRKFVLTEVLLFLVRD